MYHRNAGGHIALIRSPITAIGLKTRTTGQSIGGWGRQPASPLPTSAVARASHSTGLMRHRLFSSLWLVIIVAACTGLVAEAAGRHIHGLTRAQHAIAVGVIGGLLCSSGILIFWKWTFGAWIERK